MGVMLMSPCWEDWGQVGDWLYPPFLFLGSAVGPGHTVPWTGTAVRPPRVLHGQVPPVPHQLLPDGRHPLRGRPGLLLQWHVPHLPGAVPAAVGPWLGAPQGAGHPPSTLLLPSQPPPSDTLDCLGSGFTRASPDITLFIPLPQGRLSAGGSTQYSS